MQEYLKLDNISRWIFYPTAELLNGFIVGFAKKSNKLNSVVIDPLLFPTIALHKTQNSVGTMEKQVTLYLFYASINQMLFHKLYLAFQMLAKQTFQSSHRRNLCGNTHKWNREQTITIKSKKSYFKKQTTFRYIWFQNNWPGIKNSYCNVECLVLNIMCHHNELSKYSTRAVLLTKFFLIQFFTANLLFIS